MEPPEAPHAAAAETIEPVAARAEPQAIDLEDSSLYFNRELSWLDFNDRVLQLAEDPSTPLLERVKFCAIWETNLDEFFMVRLPALYDQIAAGGAVGDGLAATERINAIATAVTRQRERLSHCLTSKLIPELDEHGIIFVDVEAAEGEERRQLERMFERRIFPALTPLLVGLGRPFPYISNLSLSLAVVLRDPDQDQEALARVKVPGELLGRFLTLQTEEGTSLVALEDLIASNLGALFPGMEVVDHSF